MAEPAEWFTAAELAELQLPGLRFRKRWILKLAKREGWESRPASGGGRW
jgi:putative transposase